MLDTVVDAAEVALRAFGANLTREQAARLLPMWEGYGRLTDEQRVAVLARFRAAPR